MRSRLAAGRCRTGKSPSQWADRARRARVVTGGVTWPWSLVTTLPPYLSPSRRRNCHLQRRQTRRRAGTVMASGAMGHQNDGQHSPRLRCSPRWHRSPEKRSMAKATPPGKHWGCSLVRRPLPSAIVAPRSVRNVVADARISEQLPGNDDVDPRWSEQRICGRLDQCAGALPDAGSRSRGPVGTSSSGYPRDLGTYGHVGWGGGVVHRTFDRAHPTGWHGFEGLSAYQHARSRRQAAWAVSACRRPETMRAKCHG